MQPTQSISSYINTLPQQAIQITRNFERKFSIYSCQVNSFTLAVQRAHKYYVTVTKTNNIGCRSGFYFTIEKNKKTVSFCSLKALLIYAEHADLPPIHFGIHSPEPKRLTNNNAQNQEIDWNKWFEKTRDSLT